MTTFLQIDYLSEVCPFHIHQMVWHSRYQPLIRRNLGCGGYTKSLTDVTSLLTGEALAAYFLGSTVSTR